MNFTFSDFRTAANRSGLSSAEVTLFTHFLFETGHPIKSFMCSVPLGGGLPSLPEIEYRYRYDWDYLASLKADVIGNNGYNYILYEIKTQANSGALGQLLTYSWLWQNVLQMPPFFQMHLVCKIAVPGIVGALRANNIILHCSDYGWGLPPGWQSHELRMNNVILNPSIQSSSK